MSDIREINKTDIIAALELASKFIGGKKEHRLYLRHVMIKNVGDNCHIVAVDGHRLVKITLLEHNQVNTGLYSGQSVKDSIKVKNLELMKLADNSVGNFPDYERLIPESPEMGTASYGINAKYLGEAMLAYAKFFKVVSGDNFAGINHVQTSNNSANHWRYEFTKIPIKVDIIIMTMRTK